MVVMVQKQALVELLNAYPYRCTVRPLFQLDSSFEMVI